MSIGFWVTVGTVLLLMGQSPTAPQGGNPEAAKIKNSVIATPD